MNALNAPSEPPSSFVIAAIADRAGTDAMQLNPPLYSVIDLEALDELLRTGRPVRVTFEYDSFTVVVHGDGSIVIDGHEYEASRSWSE